MKSETAFGHGFQELRRRNLPFYNSTKTFQSTEKGIRKEIEAQLKRLGLSSIDFYHVWCITSLEEWRTRRKEGVIQVFRKLKEEIGRESGRVTTYGLIEGFRRHSLGRRQVAIEDDALAADGVDGR